MTPQNILKLFSVLFFYKLFATLMKIHFLSFHDILLKNLLMFFNYVLYFCKTSYNEGNKWLLLDVNPKTKFFELQKKSKATKITKCQQTNSRLINNITIDPTCYNFFLWFISSSWCFQKHIACELHFLPNTQSVIQGSSSKKPIIIKSLIFYN